jgi:predicted phage terminase large subunit-like protein
MERVLARQPKQYDYIIINQPPVTLKSTIFCIMLHGWMWARDPSLNFIGCSYEEHLMIGHAQKARDLVKSEKYQRCFPDVRIRGDMDEKGTYGTTAGGIRYSEGTRGNITGKHGDIVTVDDPLNPKAARSPAETLTVERFVLEALPNRKRYVSITPTIVDMQRLAENDTTGKLLQMEKDGKIRVKHIRLPAEDQEWVKPVELRRFYRQAGGLLFPALLSWRDLEEFKASGEYFYAGQYDQMPVPAGGGMFKVDQFRRDEECPDPTNSKLWVKQVRYWDKAGTQKGGCFTVGTRMGRDQQGRFWVIHVDRFQKDTSGREARIKQVANIDKDYVIIGVEQEGGSDGKYNADSTVKNLAGFRVVKDKPSQDKSARAEPYAAQVNGNNVYLAREGIVEGLEGSWHRAYVEELMLFWFGKYKDQVDSSSGAFKLLSSNVIQVGFF